MQRSANRASASAPEVRAKIDELTLLIAERAQHLAQRRRLGPGRELELWLEAEAQIKRERAA